MDERAAAAGKAEVDTGTQAAGQGRSSGSAAPHTDALIAAAVANHRRRAGAADPAAPSSSRSAACAGGALSGAETRPSPASAASSAAGLGGLVLGGVALPALALLVEAGTGTCAQRFIDPIPTAGHLALVAAVPAANLAGIVALRRGRSPPPLLVASLGVAAAVSAVYALVFLPLLPIALIGLLMLVGAPPLAPYTALWAAIAVRHRLLALPGRPAAASLLPPGGLPGRPARLPRHAFAWGALAGLAAMIAVEGPALVTRHGLQLSASHDAGERQRGIEMLRRWGSRYLLLAWSHEVPRQPIGIIGPIGDAIMGWRYAGRHVATARAREIYWQVTGEPFNAQPAPAAGPRPWLRGGAAFDRDLGGLAVGGIVHGLALAQSRIDGSISPEDAVAYVEWTFEVENSSTAMREARMTLALPPGGVVSRVTLWVNGVEEEAAYAGKGQVRAAYERVVRRAQDPFLVTTRGGDRVLAQAFPVPPSGGRMRFKVDITAPVELDSLAAGRLVLPAIVERNFAVGGDVRHHVWIESRSALAAADKSLTAVPLEGEATRLVGTVPDADFARARPFVTVARPPAARVAIGGSTETGFALQEIAAVPAPPAAALMIVIDGSASVARHRAAVVAALSAPEAIRTGMPVGAAIADGRGTIVAPAPWSPQQRHRILTAVAAARFEGGADNAPALAAALAAIGDREGSHVLWLHGPQPMELAGGRAALEQAAARIGRVPALSLLAVEPGPVAALPDAPWAWAARDVGATGDVARDLRRFLARATGTAAVPAVARRLLPESSPEHGGAAAERSPAANGSAHIARLAARDEVIALIQRSPAHGREAATALASRHRLVTPVSGAVVLESQRQYVEAGLAQTKMTKGTVPTVPEPETWALLAVALVALGWWLARQRHATARLA